MLVRTRNASESAQPASASLHLICPWDHASILCPRGLGGRAAPPSSSDNGKIYSNYIFMLQHKLQSHTN